MAHYAELDETNVVLRVVVVNNAYEATEADGIAWCHAFFGGGTWVKTSYNGNIRKNYAGPGFTFDAARDAFIPIKPFASWVLDEETCTWTAPVPIPDESGNWRWDEGSMSWMPLYG